MVGYATKFEELSRFFPHYNGVEYEGLKCVNFESGLYFEIKQFIGYQEIHSFSVLVNKCIIHDEDNKAKSIHYKSVSDKKNVNLNRGKSYMTPTNEGK